MVKNGRKKREKPSHVKSRKRKKKEGKYLEEGAKLKCFLWKITLLYLRKDTKEPLRKGRIKIVVDEVMIGS